MTVTAAIRYIYAGRAYKTAKDAYLKAARDILLGQMKPTPVDEIAAENTGPFDPSRFYAKQKELAAELERADKAEAKKKKES